MTKRIAAIVVAVMMTGQWAAAQASATASGGWVAAPAAGATSTLAYVAIENPTMYEVFVVSAESDAAGAVEIVEGADGSKPVRELSVPSFGSVELKPGGTQLRLKDLKKPLKPGDQVELTLTTDGGVAIKTTAQVK